MTRSQPAWCRFAGLVAALAFAAGAVYAADAPTEEVPPAVPGAAKAEQIFSAVVKVRTHAVPGARSGATLGQQREGTGIVIADDGLVLTIGYLIVEADEVALVDHRGRTLPARVVGYDHVSGFGLVRSLVPLNVAALPLGESAGLGDKEPVMIVNHQGSDDVSFAFVVAKRPFTANWEYALDEAIFTSPPALNWSGAALIGKDGRLLGVGSLVVRDAVTSGDSSLPGNMFVPIDILKPLLADLIRTGRRAGPARPWLGIAADEVQGRLVVSRVSPEGPADQAGIHPGDIILAVGKDGVHTQGEFYAKVWSAGAAGAAIPLRVLQGLEVHDVKVESIDRVDYFRPRTVH